MHPDSQLGMIMERIYEHDNNLWRKPIIKDDNGDIWITPT